MYVKPKPQYLGQPQNSIAYVHMCHSALRRENIPNQLLTAEDMTHTCKVFLIFFRQFII